MSWWILLLGLVAVGVGVLWSTRLPPSVSVDLPNPPKIDDDPIPDTEPVIERLFGLWSTPESHFWSDNLRVGPPVVARAEHVPHGPRVAEQAGWTRPYLGSTREASVWTQLVRQITVSYGIPNPLDKSFATSGVIERFLGNSLTALFPQIAPPPPEIEGILDGGDDNGAGPIGLDAGNETTETDTVLDGGDVNGL